MSLAAPAPSFDCAAKLFKLSGSIWRENKTRAHAWQEGSKQIIVESCARLCKFSAFLGEVQVEGIVCAQVFHVEACAVGASPPQVPEHRYVDSARQFGNARGDAPDSAAVAGKLRIAELGQAEVEWFGLLVLGDTYPERR